MDGVGDQIFVITLLYGGVLWIGGLIAALLLRSKVLGPSKYFLVTLVLCLLLHLGLYLLFTTGMIKVWPHFLGLNYPFLFLLGPAIYFFALFSVNESRGLRVRDSIHLVPFFLIWYWQMPFILSSGSEKLKVISYYYTYVPDPEQELIPFLTNNSFVLLLMGYSFAVLLLVSRQKKRKAYQYKTLREFSLGLIVFGLLFLVVQSGLFLSGASLVLTELILTALLSLVIFYLGYRVLGVRSQPFVDNVSLSSYQEANLTEEANQAVAQKLTSAMEEEKLFLQRGLRLDDLAQHIGVPSYQISKVLNAHMKTNFHALVAQYRVSESTEMLLNGSLKRLSIQAIGEECGFNSKASFYRAFKRLEGKTPTEFIRSKN